jgi:hypothetical protein
MCWEFTKGSQKLKYLTMTQLGSTTKPKRGGEPEKKEISNHDATN